MTANKKRFLRIGYEMGNSSAVFDDATTQIMGEAFDAVCGKLHGTVYPDPVARRSPIASSKSRAARASAIRGDWPTRWSPVSG
jgi:hypothetical protein